MEATITVEVRCVEEPNQGSSGEVEREGDKAQGDQGVITIIATTADRALK